MNTRTKLSIAIVLTVIMMVAGQIIQRLDRPVAKTFHLSNGGWECGILFTTSSLKQDPYCKTEPMAFIPIRTPFPTLEQIVAIVTAVFDGPDDDPYIAPSETFIPAPDETATLEPSETPAPSETVAPTEETSTPEPPAPPEPKPTKEPKPDKPHCDNGEGNGGEGCSPSDNGNNDED